MSPDLALGLIVGFVMGALIMGVFMGTVAHQNYEKYLEEKAVNFDQTQTIMDLENRVYPEHWILQAEGAEDPVVVRGRPDNDRHPQNRTSKLSDERAVVYDDPKGPPQVISLTDVDDLPEWEDA